MKTLRILAISLAALTAVSCGSTPETKSVLPKDGQTAIVAHRGFWNCEAGGMSENSIASLKAAQDCGLWGSEFDIHITRDLQIIVNHNDDINGKVIEEHDMADFDSDLLPNGEKRPTLDEYLTQGEKSDKTVLVVELKKQADTSREDVLIDKAVELIKAHKLFTPDRVMFISFSYHICEVIAARYPQFVNQYLNGDNTPEELAAAGINGIDYQYGVLALHPDWPARCAALGMSSNVWTVNKDSGMKKAIGYGVNTITTNEPLLLRSILGDDEFKN